MLARLAAARRQGLAELLADWQPAEHPEILRMIEELAVSLAEEAPHEASQTVAV